MLNKPKILSIHNQFPSPVALKYNLYGGVGYYRQRMPAKYLREYVFHHIGSELVNISEKEMNEKIAKYVKNSQLVYIKHVDNPHAVYSVLGACDYYNVPLIVDFDDNVLTTDGLSPHKHSYEENNERLHFLEVLLKECTAITVSVESLKDVYSKYNERIYVAPNACDMKDWEMQRKHYNRPIVGWAGSASHFIDHPVLEPVYEGVVKENPDVVFSFVGHMLPEHIKGLRRKNWEIKPGISWWEGNPDNDMTYPRLLAECGYDVGLAPLIDSQFNHSRSLVKWFEYTMVGTPMVASELGPYLNLQDGEEAYLVKTTDGWIEAINYLLKHKHDGNKLIENSRRRIEREFSIEATIPTWRKVFSTHIGNGFRAS